jgi:hypothetical protein
MFRCAAPFLNLIILIYKDYAALPLFWFEDKPALLFSKELYRICRQSRETFVARNERCFLGAAHRNL